MAVNANRIRRALSLSTSFMNLHKHRLPSISSTHSLLQNLLSSPSQIYPRRRFVHSTNIVHYSSRSFNVDKIDPDTILFEGCDYKHWLIVMDFGKDPDQRPPPEQMVETYVQTLAKVVGSVEEAKKKIYACSTTTYTGFQAEIDEETSKKLEDLPGVIFVLPDSYIDPVNKEYGGDKYINGTIIPRPPPVQYGRRRDRQLDQRPRSPMPNQQEGRGYRPQNDFADRGKFPPNSGPTGSNKDSYQSGGNAYVSPQGNHNHNMPPHQGNYNHNPPPHQGNYNQNVPPHQGNLNYNVPPHQGNYNHGMPPQGNYNHGMPPHQGNYNHGMPPQGNYNHGMPPHQGNHNHGMPPHQQNYNPGYTHPHQMKNLSGDYSSNAPLGHINDPRGDQLYNNSQGPMTNIPGQHYGHTPQGQMQYPGDGTNHSPSPVRGPGGQTGVGSFEQTGTGQYGQMPGGYEQGASTRNGHGYTSQVESQRFSAAPDQHNSTPTDYSNVSPPQPGMNQRKF